MLPRENPSARKVPISFCRLATAAYMVIIAPIIAPMAKNTETIVPTMPMNMLVACDCFSKYAASVNKTSSPTTAASTPR